MSGFDKEFLIERFVRSLGSSASPHTRRLYRRVTGRFLDFLEMEGLAPEEVSPKVVENFFFDMDAPLAPNSERAYLSVLSSLYDHLMVQEEASANPVAQYRKGARKRFARRQDADLNVMSPEMFAAVLNTVRELGATRNWSEAEVQRNIAILHVLFGSGIRRAELHALNCNSFDEKRGVLLVRGKGEKVRRAALLVETEEVLRGYLQEIRPLFSPAPDEPAMFLVRKRGTTIRMPYDAIGYMVRLTLKSSGVFMKGDMGTHVLRRSHGTLIQRKTGNPKLVQQQLGHASITTTERYVKLADDEHINQIRDMVGLDEE